MTRAVITGVSRGIGRATALAFANRGVELALLGRESDAHAQTCSDCRDLGVTVHSYACDLADHEAIGTAAQALLADGDPPDVVVNNAALLERGPRIHELQIEAWDRIMAVNLRGPFLLCRALLPAMLARGSGRFIQIASISGTIGCPQMAPYGVSKWGLIGFTRALADELRGTGLQALAILPGSVDTARLAQTPFEPDMSADDVAAVILVHALDAPAAVTGSCVQIYG